MTDSNNNDQGPNVTRLYLEGLAIHLKHRITDLTYRAFRFATTPFRWFYETVEDTWFRCEPWIARNKWRIIWSIVAMLTLTIIGGGAVSLWIWREEVSRVAQWAYAKVNGTMPAVQVGVARPVDVVEQVAVKEVGR